MSINKTKAFVTSDSRVFLTPEEAQNHELKILLGVTSDEQTPINTITKSAINSLMEHREEVLAILSTRKPRTPKAKPAAKKSKPQIVTEAA